MIITTTDGIPSCFKCNTPYQTTFVYGHGAKYIPQCWCNDVNPPSEIPTIPIPPTPTANLTDLVIAVRELVNKVSDLIDVLEKESKKDEPTILND